MLQDELFACSSYSSINMYLVSVLFINSVIKLKYDLLRKFAVIVSGNLPIYPCGAGVRLCLKSK